jgi:hypothetical protein
MLDEEIAQWVRIEAAQKKTSISDLLEEILRKGMPKGISYERAMRRALQRKPFPKARGRRLSRAEAHNRVHLS